MRDEIISIMGPSQTENMFTTRQSGGYPPQRGSLKDRVGKHDLPSSKFVSIANYKEGSAKSDISSVHHGKSQSFRRRHQSIDQIAKAKGARKLLLEDDVYSYKKEL